MGEQRNLTEENVKELSAKLEKMQETNPDLEYRFFNQDEEQSDDGKDGPTIRDVLDRITVLENRIQLIFGDHFMVNGKFTTPDRAMKNMFRK